MKEDQLMFKRKALRLESAHAIHEGYAFEGAIERAYEVKIILRLNDDTIKLVLVQDGDNNTEVNGWYRYGESGGIFRMVETRKPDGTELVEFFEDVLEANGVDPLSAILVKEELAREVHEAFIAVAESFNGVPHKPVIKLSERKGARIVSPMVRRMANLLQPVLDAAADEA